MVGVFIQSARSCASIAVRSVMRENDVKASLKVIVKKSLLIFACEFANRNKLLHCLYILIYFITHTVLQLLIGNLCSLVTTCRWMVSGRKKRIFQFEFRTPKKRLSNKFAYFYMHAGLIFVVRFILCII